MSPLANHLVSIDSAVNSDDADGDGPLQQFYYLNTPPLLVSDCNNPQQPPLKNWWYYADVLRLVVAVDAVDGDDAVDDVEEDSTLLSLLQDHLNYVAIVAGVSVEC